MTISEKIQAEINWIHDAISADNGNYMYNLDIMTDALNHIAKDVERMEAKADKYRWHDLRKDPYDLPKYCDTYLVYRPKGYEKYSFCYCGADGTWYDNYRYDNTGRLQLNDVIAWREIEPFESEVE